MPYYHTTDDQKIHFWRRKCTGCGKTWPVNVLFQTKVPSDMYRAKESRKPRSPTSYATWANKFPMVAGVAGKLPNWPRWLRVLTFIGVLSLFFFIIYLLVN